MRMCQQCGKFENDNTQYFCQYCGSGLIEVSYQQLQQMQQMRQMQMRSAQWYQRSQYPMSYQQTYQNQYNQNYQQSPYADYTDIDYSTISQPRVGQRIAMSVTGLIMAILGFIFILVFEDTGSSENSAIALLNGTVKDLYNECLALLIISYILVVAGIILSIIGFIGCRGGKKAIGIVGLCIALITAVVVIIDTVSFSEWAESAKLFFTYIIQSQPLSRLL